MTAGPFVLLLRRTCIVVAALPMPLIVITIIASGSGGSSAPTACATQSFGRLANSSAADVDAAVHAAEAALPDWAAMPPTQRARLLYALADYVEAHLEDFARAEVRPRPRTPPPPTLRGSSRDRHYLIGIIGGG